MQDDDDDDIINSWNLRKCSAAGLDILSTVFGDEILPVLMPLVQVYFYPTLSYPLPIFQVIISCSLHAIAIVGETFDYRGFSMARKGGCNFSFRCCC